MPDQQIKLLRVSTNIIRLATERKIDLRLIGGLGVYKACQQGPECAYGRQDYRDIDMLGRSEQNNQVADFFKSIGFRRVGLNDWTANLEFHIYRAWMAELGRELDIEVYFGSLRFNHTIPKPYFNTKFPYTIPITQLLVSKWAIVELNEKDIVDIAMILLSFPIEEDNASVISYAFLTETFSDGIEGARIAKTCKINLSIIRDHFKGMGIGEELKIKLFDQIAILEEILDRSKKSSLWNVMDFIGLEKKWYKEAQPRQL